MPAVSNPIANNLALTTSTPALGSAQLPTNKVSSYLNQQLSGLNTGTSATVGAPTNIAGQQAARAGGNTPLGASASLPGQSVAEIGSATADNIAAGNARLNLYAQIKQQHDRAAQAQQSSGGSGGFSQQSYGGTPQGRAYTPNGQLSASRNEVLQDASSYLGDRYVLGGSSHQGIDCSGLVMMVYGKLGYGPYVNSHLAGHQAAAIPGVRTSIGNLRPGDIVAWRDGSHIAIYAGNGNIIEAANERVGTVERKIWASPSQIYGIALRLPGE